MTTRLRVERMLRGVTCAIALAALASCSAKQGFGDNDNCDYLVLPGFANGGSGTDETLANCPLDDVRMDVDIAIEFAGPGGVGIPEPTPRSAFLITHQDIVYRNINTGGTRPGIDVPAPQQVFISFAPEPPPVVYSVEGFPVLRGGAKEQPPLNDASFYANGGVAFQAQITWWGHPAVDNEAYCYGTHNWSFSVTRELVTPTSCF